jgi:hypothetical protein
MNVTLKAPSYVTGVCARVKLCDREMEQRRSGKNETGQTAHRGTDEGMDGSTAISRVRPEL